MKPRPYVEIQAAMALLAALVVLLVLGSAADLSTAIFFSVGFSIWCFFAARYGLLLRNRGVKRSRDRRAKDRVMIWCLLGGLLLPTILAWIDFADVRLAVFGTPLNSGEAIVASVGFLAIPLGILVSSSVDWYLIRPFREGVLNEPTCRPESHEHGRGMDYARYWVLHRMVSEFFVYAGIVVLVGSLFAGASTWIHSEEGKSALGFAGGVGIAVWSISELSGLRAALRFVRFPYCELGSWVAGRTNDCLDISGFVLDVSVSPGVQLISEPRGYGARDIADPKSSVPLRQVHNLQPAEEPHPLCAEKCEFWNPDCEVGLREREQREDAR